MNNINLVQNEAIHFGDKKAYLEQIEKLNSLLLSARSPSKASPSRESEDDGLGWFRVHALPQSSHCCFLPDPLQRPPPHVYFQLARPSAHSTVRPLDCSEIPHDLTVT